MKRQDVLKIVLFGIFSILSTRICLAATPIYDERQATAYANIWWGTNGIADLEKWKIYNAWRNTNTEEDDINEWQGRPIPSYGNNYYNHYVRPDYTDCAHFVSQCLIAGGLRDEMHDYSVAITHLASGQYTNLPLRDYGGLIFETGNPHNPNNGYIKYPADRIIAAYSQDIANNEWALFVNTRSRSGNIYANTLSLFSYLLHQYHAQYYYGQRPDNLAAGDVYYPSEKHVTLVNIRSGSTQTDDLVYTAHTTDVRDEDLPAVTRFNNGYHFFHMVRSVPYVKRVTLEQNGIFIYDAEWIDNGTSRTLNIRNHNRANYSANINIEIEFSQSIKSRENPNLPLDQSVDGVTLNLIGANKSTVNLNARLDERGIILTSAISPNKMIANKLYGDYTIDIQATSYADDCNQLDGNPATVAQYSDESVAGGLTKFNHYEDAAKKETHAGGQDWLVRVL